MQIVKNPSPSVKKRRQQWTIAVGLVLFGFVPLAYATTLMSAMAGHYMPSPDKVPIVSFEATASDQGLTVRVDEKLFIQLDSWASVFFGELLDPTKPGPETFYKTARIGEETLIAVGRTSEPIDEKWKEILRNEKARHERQPRQIGRDILDSDSEIVGVKFGVTTTTDLAKKFGQAKVTAGSTADSLHTWNLKGLIIATDSKSPSVEFGSKIDLVAALAWKGTLNRALSANGLQPLPEHFGSLEVGQKRSEIEKMLKVHELDGCPSSSRIMIRQAGEKNVFGWVTWSEDQTLRSIQFSDTSE